MLWPVLASKPSKRLERSLKKFKKTQIKKNIVRELYFHKKRPTLHRFGFIFCSRSFLWPLLVPLISHCSLLDASGVLLVSHVASSGLSRDRLGLVFGHPWCISGSLGRILGVHLHIWKVSRLLFDASCLSWLACGVSWASPEPILDSSWAMPGASCVLSHTGCFL